MTIAGARSHFAISDSVFPVSEADLSGTADLVAAIYERVRRADGESPSWQERPTLSCTSSLIGWGMLHKLPQLVK